MGSGRVSEWSPSRSESNGDAVLAGLPAVATPESSTLILGSMPSAESLRRGEYYANPRNQFWRILAAVLGIPDPGRYAARIELLGRHHIALWDVLAACERRGSLDAKIVRGSERPADLRGFLGAHPHVHTVALNGTVAADFFRRLVLPHLGPEAGRLRILELPSTSPANTARIEIKIARWRRLLDAKAV
jgi:double-stranded uracil-DNA glycosylase